MFEADYCKDFEGYGIEYHKRSFTTNMKGYHAHKMFELSFIYSGEGVVRVEETDCELRRNVIYLLRPNVMHKVVTNPNVLYDRTVIYISLDYFHEFFQKYMRNFLSPVYEPDEALMHTANLTDVEFDSVIALTDRIVQLSEQTSASRSMPELMMTVHMMELLTIVGCAYMRDAFQMPLMSGARQGLSLGDILTYINRNIGEKLTIESLAEHFHFSKQHISRFFGEKMGTPLSKYILHCKVAAAKHMLITSNMTIDEVGQKLGFCDTPHFYRVFKSTEGETPRKFRERSASALFEPVQSCNVYFLEENKRVEFGK